MKGGKLTAREIEVLRLCAAGLSDKQMAERLGISAYTVGHHVHHILKKTDCANRAEAVSYGFRVGLLAQATETPIGSEAELPRSDTAGVVAVLPSGKESWRPELERTTGYLAALLRRATEEPTTWADLFGELSRAFEAHIGLLTWTDYQTPRMTSVTISATMPPEWIHRYDERYVKFAPIWEVVRQAPGDFLGVSDDADMGPDLSESPFYLEYMLPLDIAHGIGWTAYLDDRWVCTLFVGQSTEHGPTTPWERALATALFPHVRHELSRLWKGGDGRVDGFGAAASDPEATTVAELCSGTAELSPGVILLDRRLRVVSANPAATSLLARRRWLLRSDGTIRAVDTGDTRIIHDTLRSAVKAARQGEATPPESILIRASEPCEPPLRALVSALPAGPERPASLPAGASAALILQEMRLRAT